MVCDVCGNDAVITLYVDGNYPGDVYTFRACSSECENEILGAE